MDASSLVPYHEWKTMVRATIEADWLEMIDDSDLLRGALGNTLQILHRRYRPQRDGSWAASPRWPAMFSWTACPLKKVKVIILLKSPKPAGSSSAYESTGYGAGVQRKDGANTKCGQLISAIGTVWAMLETARQCLQYPDSNLGALLKSKYHHGFNPACLSRRGILFLNVAQTSGRVNPSSGEKSNVELWQEFTLGLLTVLPTKRKTPLFQWYINMVIQERLEILEEEGKFVVSKPDALYFGSDHHQHIGYFKERQISGYAMELRAKRYQEHRKILAEIYMSMVCESEVQTYAVPEAIHGED